MRTMLAVTGTLALLVLAGCGGDGEAAEPAGSTSAEASPSVDPGDYADEIVTAFRDVHPVGAVHYEVPVSDWSAFVSVVDGLTPPDDMKLDHERMVAGFEAYVEGRENMESRCAGVTWTSPGWGACSTATSSMGDAWTAALDRAYEIPGLSWGSLLN